MNQPSRAWFFPTVAAFVIASLAAMAQAATKGNLAPNPEFRQGTDKPAGWKLSGGQGRWIDRDILEITGTGSGSNSWQSEPLTFQPGALYRFEMRARQTTGSGGCIISGPSFANRDYHAMAPEWKEYGHVFRVPDPVDGDYLRVGQWESKGTVQFDSVRLVPVLPIHTNCGPYDKLTSPGEDLVLGEGESIKDGRYLFQGRYGHEGSNFHRTLVNATAGFNSERWCFSGDGQLTYRFALPRHRFLSAEAEFTVNWHSSGGCLAEVSSDGHSWRPLITQNGLGTAKAALPAEVFPAKAIFLRLRASKKESSFQVNQVDFRAALDGKPSDATGETVYACLQKLSPDLQIERAALANDLGSNQRRLELTLKNPTSRKYEIRVLVSRLPKTPEPGREAEPVMKMRSSLASGASSTCTAALFMPLAGAYRFAVRLEPGDGAPTEMDLTLQVPEYYRADYGENLPGTSGKAAVWWCDATRKIPRRRPAPQTAGKAARLWAARNDREAVQIVVQPANALKGLTASAGPLAGPDGAVIPAENVKVLRVHYHFVDHPTDATGVRDWWPDALPPLSKPIDVPARHNQPLWILVSVPKDAKAGDYSGTISLKAEGWSASVPLRLHVWDFALPERNHLQTAFGFSPGMMFRYHQLKTEADKRKVLDLYFRSFAEHRISTYDPTPLDPFHVKFLPEAKPPRAEIDFAAFDRAMAAAVEKYHFTGLRLPIAGMGGGTFHERHEPSIGNLGEQSPEYQALFASQVKQIEEHLRQKGWLDMAYVYWFDEPDPKDYTFVRNGMERLKRYAPGIQRMLTEEPGDALAGAVDLWCPVSFNYDHKAAEKRRAHGERFWWYVCCGPKAPYCTLFIDHPATELRVWHWQTWQRKIVGTLVWETNYWTSEAAYPDKAQDPYEDPMGYVSGYSTPKGTKRYWGNGDGRFIYPPEAASVPGKSGPGPVLEPPVASIRWEMLREGVEDYEFLWLLRDLVAKKRSRLTSEEIRQCESLLEVPAAITKDMTTFTTDPAPIYARRAAIAAAIERLLH